jgi:hypothetical protein
MVKTIQNTARSTRQWMIIAFIAGMVFMAALAQTMMTANKDFSGTRQLPASSGEPDSLTPAPIPDDNYLLDSHVYALVYTCPEWKAM